jgi:alkylation response protein AidB-like acyl-CoA dehydrogenase
VVSGATKLRNWPFDFPGKRRFNLNLNQDITMAGTAAYNWEDPLDLESWLTDEEKMIRDSARAYAQDKLQPRVKQAFRDEYFDRKIMTELGAMGFIGIMTAEKYGGLWSRWSRD